MMTFPSSDSGSWPGRTSSRSSGLPSTGSPSARVMTGFQSSYAAKADSVCPTSALGPPHDRGRGHGLGGAAERGARREGGKSQDHKDPEGDENVPRPRHPVLLAPGETRATAPPHLVHLPTPDSEGSRA